MFICFQTCSRIQPNTTRALPDRSAAPWRGIITSRSSIGTGIPGGSCDSTTRIWLRIPLKHRGRNMISRAWTFRPQFGTILAPEGMDAPFAANAQTNGTWKWHSRKWSWSTSSVGMFKNSMDFVLPVRTELRVTKPKHSTKTVTFWLILPYLHRVLDLLDLRFGVFDHWVSTTLIYYDLYFL